MKPHNLYFIYEELVHKKHYMGLTCFRVRDTHSLMDYLICDSSNWKWDYRNMPTQMWGLLLEPVFNVYYPMEVTEPKFTLLSAHTELYYFQTIGNKAVLDACRQSYRRKS